MSKRNSGYERVPNDAYYTQEMVVDCLVRSAVLPKVLWENASGPGWLAEQLRRHAYKVYASDIDQGEQYDFTKLTGFPGPDVRGIVSNPPFEIADAFIENGLSLIERRRGFMAYLLPCDFDHAGGRTRFFRDCPAFAGQIKLLRRITWFKRADGGREDPSENHSWFVWDFRHVGEPWVRYETWPD